MSSSCKLLLRAMLGMALGTLLGLGSPLRAQLDPRLQPASATNPTDFLDLYQQSTSLKAKPEIATIFDMSGSMNSLMFHPLYYNADVQDADAYRYMTFSFNTNYGVSGAIVAGNQYKVTASVNNGTCTSATAASFVLTVDPVTGIGTVGSVSTPGSASCTTVSGAVSYTITATAAGDSSATSTFKITATTAGSSSPYTWTNYTVTGTTTPHGTYTFMNSNSTQTPLPVIAATSSSGPPYTPGTVITLTVYLNHPFNSETEVASDKTINWSASGGTLGSPTQTEVVSNTLYKSVITYTVPTTNQTQIQKTQLSGIYNVGTSATITNGTTFAAGATLSLNDYFVFAGNSTQIKWTTANNQNNSSYYIPSSLIVNPIGTSSGTNITTLTSPYGLQAAGQVTWHVPAINTNNNGGGGTTTHAVVQASLDASASAYMTANGITAVGALSSLTNAASGYEALRKPDGTAVTYADANSVAAGLFGSAVSPGESDIRNWIRAASHVRFKYGSGATARTIDIPIPWKNTTPLTPASGSGTRTFSTGVPLTSTTVTDTEVVVTTVNGQTITTTYGSGNAIELDSTYKVETGGSANSPAVFSAHANGTDYNGNSLTASQATACYLNVVYRPAYISWLFLGKYQSTSTLPYYNASYTGKYIVFDAVANISQVGGQGAIAWGSAYGPATVPWGNISVSQYNSSGTYTTAANLEASNYVIPALTRLQAVKSAAITTWINHQADVFWAFRELDPVGEDGQSGTDPTTGGSTTTLNSSSSTNIASGDPTTTHINGNDSGWTVLNNYLSTDATTTGAGTSTVTVTSSTTGHSVVGMKRIAALFASGETPLTYAVARTLAQYQSLDNVFNAAEGSSVSQCVNSFLMLFTDGVDNNGNTNATNGNATSPYFPTENGVVTMDPKAGNDSVISNGPGYANLNPTGLSGGVPTSGIWWNIFTYAGMAAHLADSTMGTLGTDFLTQGTPPSGTVATPISPSGFLPLAIPSRGDASPDGNYTLFNKPHRVTLMTVGVSLGGTITNGPKQNLFWAAVAGDPGTTAATPLSSFHTFVPPTGTWPSSGYNGAVGTYPGTWTPNDWVYNTQDPTDYPNYGSRATGAVYFFDAANPAAASADMNYAFKLAIGSPSNNATASPGLPFVGASLGGELYLGSFQPPAAGGVLWPGDLMMFSTRNTNGNVAIIDKNGNPATALSALTAQWSAANAIKARLFSSRNLYTRYPASGTGTEPGLSKFVQSWTGSSFTTPTDPIFGYLNSSLSLATKQTTLYYAAGGDTSTIPPTQNRANIMGDIVDSAPAAVEYAWSDVSALVASNATLNAVGGNRFRLILAGDNQGWIHGFGEVTKTVSDPNGDNNTLVTGAVDELWAFMPTDFLAHLDYITNNSNTHRFMADGAPNIYFLDLPKSGSGSGNGVVDLNNSERAIAVIGLGKGGRSYYALNILHPFLPTLQWALVPDEIAAGSFPSTRLTTYTSKTSVNSYAPTSSALLTLMGNMGFSTTTPAFGRITFNNMLRDAVFLGGGFSETQVDTTFGTPLGRSAFALDVYTGEVLAATTLPANTTLTPASPPPNVPGPVGTGIIPFEFILNSGMAQRAYFLDYYGGLWAWGAGLGTHSSGVYANFREDSSELTSWSLRKVFQDNTTLQIGGSGPSYPVGQYTTPPAPFSIGQFTGPALTGSVTPPAVGVAMVSGDRNNPLDRSYGLNHNPEPAHNNLIVVFDRQDSSAFTTPNIDSVGIQFTNLEPLSSTPLTAVPTSNICNSLYSIFTSTCSNYFLQTGGVGGSPPPMFGYYLAFPNANSTSHFLPKGINPPLVVANSLLYSYFTPLTSDPCTGGTGSTSSFIIDDVMHPIAFDQRAGLSGTPSGATLTWSGVASNFIGVGTTAVLQAGSTAVANPQPGAATTAPAISTTTLATPLAYPKIRVWRTVQ